MPLNMNDLKEMLGEQEKGENEKKELENELLQAKIENIKTKNELERAKMEQIKLKNEELRGKNTFHENFESESENKLPVWAIVLIVLAVLTLIGIIW